MSHNIFPRLIEIFAENFKQLQFVDADELQDFLLSDLPIEYKIIGLNNLVAVITKQDYEQFPAAAFERSLERMGQFLDGKDEGFRENFAIGGFKEANNFFACLNASLVGAFRLSAAEPTRGDISELLMRAGFDWESGQEVCFGPLLQPYLRGEKQVTSEKLQLLKGRAEKVALTFGEAYANLAFYGDSASPACMQRIITSLWVASVLGGVIFLGLAYYKNWDNDFRFISGVVMLAIGLAAAVADIYFRCSTQGLKRGAQRRLASVVNHDDLVLQIEPEEIVSPRPTENTPLL